MAESEEIPLYKDTKEREDFIEKNLPEDRPKKGTEQFKVLSDFCQNVEIILQTVNENEYDAATTFLKPPDDLFEKAVIFPENCMVLGMFGDKRTALIQTRVGENAGNFIEKAQEKFPRAVYFIGIGVCYAFDKDKHKLGDVIASNKICTFSDSAIHGELTQDRGERISVIDNLQDTFCRARTLSSKFKVCEGRFSKAYEGPIVSFPLLIKDAVFRDKILKAVPGAIAGEMEGGQLLKFVQKKKIKGIIVIKGVVDYGDENKKKDWQFIAARAALHYTDRKLHNKDSELDEISPTAEIQSVVPRVVSDSGEVSEEQMRAVTVKTPPVKRPKLASNAESTSSTDTEDPGTQPPVKRPKLANNVQSTSSADTEDPVMLPPTAEIQSVVPSTAHVEPDSGEVSEEQMPAVTVENSDFISHLTPQARKFLDYRIDQGHKGVNKDLNTIAEQMVDWKEKLSDPMELTRAQIHDIEMGQYRDNHELQRRQVLRIWQNKKMLNATYRNLLKLFVDAGHLDCANAVCDVLNKRGTEQ